MHAEAHEFVSRYRSEERIAVLDLGGRDVNGTCRDLFPAAEYRVLDLREGANVDIVADAADWQPDRQYDVVLSTEVFEHTARWREICMTAHRALTPGGRFVVTAAGPKRPEHSAIDGLGLQTGEHYGNIDPEALHSALAASGFGEIFVEARDWPSDVRAAAVKPEQV